MFRCVGASVYRGAEPESVVAVQDQERIIAAYGDENKVAAQQIKALEGRLREKDEEMRGERQRLESEFVRNMEAQRLRSAGTATKLQYASSAAIFSHSDPSIVFYYIRKVGSMFLSLWKGRC